jgi:hypothetical protein
MIAAAAVLVAACGGDRRVEEAAGPPTTGGAAVCPDPPPGAARTVVLCGIDLAGDAVLGVDAHPTAAPVTLRSAASGIEACPPRGSLLLGGWPGALGFDECRAVDARGVTLPATTGAEHVGWELRAAPGATVADAAVTVAYAHADRHFVVVPPAGARDVTVVFRPARAGTVGASALDGIGGLAAGGAGVRVEQFGAVLAEDPDAPGAGIQGPRRFTVTIGAPVRASVGGRGAAMLLEWE